MITVALAGAAERAQRFAGIEERLQRRFAEVLAAKKRGKPREHLVRAKRRFHPGRADLIAALDAAIMDELEA